MRFPFFSFGLLLATFKSNSCLVDTPGTTILSYTPDGRRVITAGSNSAIRIYTIGEDGEPMTVDDGVDGHLGIVATVCFIIEIYKNATCVEREHQR
jgi:WD40 repeat protein